jgi:hypothetical protein
LLARAASPCWIIEHSFRENQDGLINPSYLKLFEVFWTAGYACETFDLERRPVLRTDVERWLATGVRDFGGINLLFRKP